MTTSDPQPSHPSSRSLFRNMAGSSAFYSITLVGQRLAGMVLLPIYTRYLAPAGYGALELVEQVTGVTSILLGASFSSALGYFYFEKDSDQNQRVAAGTAVSGSLVIGIFVGILGWLLSGLLSRVAFGSNQYAVFLRIAFGGIVLSLLFEAVLSWLRVTDRSGTFSIATLSRIAVQVASTVILVMVLHWGLTGILVGNLLASGVASVMVLFIFLRSVPLRLDPVMFGRMLRYSAPLALSSSALFVVHFGDRFFLRSYRSLTDVGVYALAYKLGMLLAFVHSAFHSYWSSQVYQIMKRPDSQAVLARTFTYMVTALSFCAVGLIVAASPAIRVLTTPSYAAAVGIVPIVVAAYLVRAIGDFFRCLFYVENRPGYDAACNWLGALVCLAGYFLLIPPYGMRGAAVSTLLSFLLIGAAVIPWTYRLRPFRLEPVRLLKTALATAVPICLYFLVPVSSLGGQIGWGALLILLHPAILLGVRFATPGEQNAALSAAGRLVRGARISP